MKVRFYIYLYWGKTRSFVSDAKSIDDAKKIAEKIATKDNVQQCGYEILQDGDQDA